MLGDEDEIVIVNGIENGFHIVDPKFQLGEAFNKNHKSAIEVKSEIEKMITKEIECGNYVITKRKPSIVSPLGQSQNLVGVIVSYMIVVCLSVVA